MRSWAQELCDHLDHEEFENYDWAPARQLGFGCRCGGEHQEWWTSLIEIRRRGWWATTTDARERRRPMARHPPDWIEWGTWDDAVIRAPLRVPSVTARARLKARALLHYNLTKEQRWDLRASRSFVMVGKDGKQYRIREHQAVQLLDERGQATHTLCVVPAHSDGIPSYDIMLAQKLMLDSDPEAFWKLANIMSLRQPEPLAQVG